MVKRRNDGGGQEAAPGGPRVKKKLTTLLLLERVHAIVLRIERQLAKLHPHRPTLGLSLSVITKEGHAMPMLPPFSLPNNVDLKAETAPADAAGNPLTPALVWLSSDESVLKLEVAADTLSARGVTGAPGSTLVTVTDPVSGVSDGDQITVNAQGVATIGLKVSIQDKAAPTP